MGTLHHFTGFLGSGNWELRSGRLPKAGGSLSEAASRKLVGVGTVLVLVLVSHEHRCGPSGPAEAAGGKSGATRRDDSTTAQAFPESAAPALFAS